MRSSKELTKERTKTMRIFPRLRVFLLVFNGAAMLMTGKVSEAQDRSQGRSMVISRNGIVAAGSRLAAQAGERRVGRGGKRAAGAGVRAALMGWWGTAGRARAERGGSVSQSRAGVVARADRATRAGGVLQRRNCREDSGLDEAAQRTDDRAGFVRILRRICRADFHQLSRLDDLRTATQRAGNRGT